jgi:hypothetical protein
MHLFQLAVQDIRVVDQFFEPLGVSLGLPEGIDFVCQIAVRPADLADLIYETLALFFKE